VEISLHPGRAQSVWFRPGRDFRLDGARAGSILTCIIHRLVILLAVVGWLGVFPAAQGAGVGFSRRLKVESPSGKAGFTAVHGSFTGINFTNVLHEANYLANQNLLNGSGVALGDYDGDGWCDVYLCNLDGENRLFKNLGGWRFRDVTAEAGVGCPTQQTTGAVFADVNGDGRLDLLVTALGGPNACFINQGGGKFADMTAASGIASRYGAMSMALADVDGNGTLDLYIANYGATSIIRSGGALNVTYVKGKPVVRGRYAKRIQIIGSTMFELGEPDGLYLNDGTGKFKAVSWTDGTFLDEKGQSLAEAPWDQGLSVMFRDVNGDRAPDIYVCNDAFTPDRFWINDGRGRFRAMTRQGWASSSYFSMGVDFADFDRDGDDDFFVLDMLSREHRYRVTQKGMLPPQPRPPGDLVTRMQMRRNTLFQNRGDGTYAEIANFAGVAGSEWSWNPVFVDVDLDGWEDILVSNGFAHNLDDMDMKQRIRSMGRVGVEQSRQTVLLYPALDTPNMAFRNNRNATFSEAGQEWGFNATELSNGFALGDLDNDGDMDVVLNCLNGPGLLYRNDCAEPRIAVRLKGKVPNTQGIGARIIVQGGPVEQSQEMIAGGRYVSSDEALRVFACGNAANKMRVEVIWRSGLRGVVEGLEANGLYEIDEAAAQVPASAAPERITPLFSDASGELEHKHHELEFDEFERQPSLPHRLSQGGPGVSWFDLDGNGWDDLLVGSGRGGHLSLFFNEAPGKFRESPATIPARDDLSTILAWRKGPGVAEMIMAAGNFETGGTNQLLLFEIRGTNVQRTGSLPVKSVVGPLAMTQLRGTMVLFAGGRFVASRYPEAAPSHLFVLLEGKWVEDSRSGEALSALGAVTGAVWSDLNQDGAPELVVSRDWGTIGVFQDVDGSLVDRGKDWGLDQLAGRWQSIAAGDFDGDGRMDLVAGNWGLNSFYNQAPDGQVELHFGDFNGVGRIEMVEAFRDPGGRVFPWRDREMLAEALPWLPQVFATHHAYAAAGISDILGTRAATGTVARTQSLASTLFLNRGETFEAIPLPAEAQYTPVFGIAVADFDLDGFQDMALAQNFFAVREGDGPLDAGRALFLRGGRGGKLTPLDGRESGLMAYGEQRGCAAADFDKDGRVDIVLGQNGTETKLFRNTSKESGTRVRLAGGGLNAEAIGAQIWPEGGPAVELQAGGGYWSRDSATKVFPANVRQLQVRRPGGKVSQITVPPGAKEIEIREDGTVLQIN
jgi:hypothetical protein